MPVPGVRRLSSQEGGTMNQRELPLGPAATDARIRQAKDGAERESPGWTEQAVDALRRYALTVDSFIIEDARASIAALVGDPSEPRAWGAATRMAKDRGYIEALGAFRADQWGSPKPIYRRGGS